MMNRLVNKAFRKLARIHQRLRIAYYSWISSGEVRITGKPVRIQPVYITGRGECIFSGVVRIGCCPSPDYFSTYAHFDLRGNGARIEIVNDFTWAVSSGFFAGQTIGKQLKAV